MTLKPGLCLQARFVGIETRFVGIETQFVGITLDMLTFLRHIYLNSTQLPLRLDSLHT